MRKVQSKKECKVKMKKFIRLIGIVVSAIFIIKTIRPTWKVGSRNK